MPPYISKRDALTLAAIIDYYRTAKKCPFEVRQSIETLLAVANESPKEAIERLQSVEL